MQQSEPSKDLKPSDLAQAKKNMEKLADKQYEALGALLGVKIIEADWLPPDSWAIVAGKNVYGKVTADFSEYSLTMDGEVMGITCRKCGLTSFHPEDVRHRFCANCDKFHKEPDSRGRRTDL